MIALLVATAGMAGEPPARPLRLQVESTSNAQVLRIIGDAQIDCHAEYALEVASGGGNSSVQRGSVDLRPGQRSTIATVRLAGQSSRNIHASLSVQPCGGAAYEDRWSSGERQR